MSTRRIEKKPSSVAEKSGSKSSRRFFLEGFLLLFAVGSTFGFVLGRLGPPVVEVLASPWTLHFSILMTAAAGLLLLLGRRRLALAMLPGLAWAWWVVVSVLSVSSPTIDGPVLRIVSANVGMIESPDPATIDWLASTRADLIGLLECTPGWVTAVEAIEREDGRRWTTIIARPRMNDTGGIALFGLEALRDGRIESPVDGGLPQLEITAITTLGPLRVLLVHPIPPLGFEMTRVRNETFDWMVDRCVTSSMPTLVMGDLNETPFGRTFRDFLAATGLRGAGGWSPSWPIRILGITVPSPLRIPIDHVLVPPGFVIRTHRLGPDIGSDHRPVLVDVARTSG